MAEINTNWCQSVGGVVLRDGRVLLARLNLNGFVKGNPQLYDRVAEMMAQTGKR